MASLTLQTATYSGAAVALRGRESRRIGHNTTLHTSYTGDEYAVRFHSTDILTMTADGSVEINTGGWWTVTTLQRLNALLPAPYALRGHRIGKTSHPYLYVRSYPVTPYVDGLTVNAAAETVSYNGAVILTADDIAAIITAAQERRATLDARREVRRTADHAARPAGPSDTFRHGWQCDECRTLRDAERAAYRAVLAAEHVAYAATLARNPTDADPWTLAEYAAAGSHVRTHGDAVYGIGCPWECPNR